MSELRLATVPGLDVRLHWRAVRDRLLDEFPAVSDVLATTMPETLLIVHDGSPDAAWLDIAAAIHSRRERELHSVVARAMLQDMPRTKSSSAPPVLHELEAEIMAEVWRQGETTVKLVMEALNKNAKPPRAYTTYMTVMRRLSDKGMLDRTRSGRQDNYAPRYSRDEYQELRAAAEVHDLVDEFGDVALAHFARSLSTLDPARRRRLQRLANSR